MEADPSEIARMGAIDAGMDVEQPTLDLQFADVESRKLFGSSLEIQSLHFHPRVDPAQLKPASASNPFEFILTPVDMNLHFYEDFVDYVAASALLNPVGFALTNNSGVPARAVELRIQLPRQDGLHVVDEADRPDPPSKHFIPRFRSSIADLARAGSPDPHVSSYGSHHEIVVHFGNVLPRSTVWSTGSVFVGAEASQAVVGDARIYAENLADPLEFPLEISIAVEVKPMKLEQIRNLIKDQER
jgi:hypothetical protein